VNSFPRYEYGAVGANSTMFALEAVMNLIGFPVALFAISILSLLVFIFILLTRICCKCCKCIPDIVTRKDEERRKKVKRNKYCCSFLFFLVVALTAAADLYSFTGLTDLNLAVSTASDGMVTLKERFTDVSVGLNNVSNVTITFFEWMNNTCPAIWPRIKLHHEDAVKNVFATTVNFLVDGFDVADTNIVKYGGYTSYIPYGIYGLLAICALFLIGFFFPCTYMLKFDMFLSILVYLLVAIICFVMTILLIFLGAFCSDPNGIVLDLLPAGDGRDIASYFLVCDGPKPADVAFPYGDPYDAWIRSCNPSPSEQVRYYQLSNLTEQTISNFDASVTCELIAEGWDLSVPEALCTHFFTGFYSIWLSLYVSIFLLFVTMIVCSLMYQYYRKEVKEFINNDVRVSPGGDIELQQAYSKH